MSLIAAVYSAVLGLGKRTWASGMTVKKNEIVKSPADNEDYERITATGGGTTDPADDTTNYVARSYRRTISLPAVTASSLLDAVTTTSVAMGATRINTPAVAVGVRGNVLSITGRGNIDYLLLNKSASSSMLIEIVCDGRTIYSQNPGLNNVNSAVVPIGMLGPSSDHSVLFRYAIFDPLGVEFRRSFEVFVTPVTAALTTSSVLAYHTRGLA